MLEAETDADLCRLGKQGQSYVSSLVSQHRSRMAAEQALAEVAAAPGIYDDPAYMNQRPAQDMDG